MPILLGYCGIKNTNYFVPKVYIKFCVKHKLLTTYIARKPIPLKVGFIGLIASTVVIFTVVLLIVVGTKKTRPYRISRRPRF